MHTYLLNVRDIRESQGERGHSHGPAIPKGAAAIELVPGRLVDIVEL